MPRREYTDDEKARALAVLASCDGNETQAAKETGIPRITIRCWANGRGVNAGTVADATHKKGELSEFLREKAWMLAGAMTKKKADESTLIQIATSFGIVADKIVLLEDVAAERLLIEAELNKLNEAKESSGSSPSVTGTTGSNITKEYINDNTSTSFTRGADGDQD